METIYDKRGDLVARQGNQGAVPGGFNPRHRRRRSVRARIPVFSSPLDGYAQVACATHNRGSGLDWGLYEEVLQGSFAEAFPVGTHMYIDHATEAETDERPEGTLTKLAAVPLRRPTGRGCA